MILMLKNLMEVDTLKEYIIRSASLEDAQAILDIYLPFITETTDTFESRIPSLNEYQDRLSAILQQLPFLVVEVEDKLIAFAYASHFQEGRPAYKYTSILSMYVTSDYQGTQVAQSLYDAIIDQLKEKDIVQVYVNVTASNLRSRAFFEKNDFQNVGQMPRFGYKFDQWHDIIWYAKSIQYPIL